MKLLRKYANIKRMWEERRIVKYLIKYHSNPALDLDSKVSAVKDGVERSLLFKYIMMEMYNATVTEVGIDEENHTHWKKVRYLVDECIEDDYLREIKRGPYEYIVLTSKGKKLSRWYYFYLKYILEEFGEFKLILIGVLGTILTSSLGKYLIHQAKAWIVK